VGRSGARSSPIAGAQRNPRVIRAGARANSQESFPALTLVLDTPSTFTIASDAGTNSFTGDEIRLESVGPIFLDFPLIEAFFATVEMVTLQASGVPVLTITGEREVREPAPRLARAPPPVRRLCL